MTLPFYMKGGFEYPTAMALATVLGFGFGFVLERAGFGRATILASQFYGENNRVLKVMFSAIVTTAVGIGIFAGVGLLDIAALSVPATFLWPHLVGGLLLGVGFVVSGYCPGTAVVGTASGHLDAMVTLGGIVVGSVVFGLAYPALESFYLSGEMGRTVLTDLLGLPWPVLAFGVVLMAIGAFFGAEKLEAILARKADKSAPDVAPKVRRAVFGGFVAAGVLGMVTLALPAPEEDADASSTLASVESIEAFELARELVQNPSAYYVVDLRAPEACLEKRVPGALCATEDDPEHGFVATLPPTRTLLLYGDGELDRVPKAARQFKGEIAILDGGMRAFEAAVLTQPEPPSSPTPESIEFYELQSALYRHFTGSAAKAAPVMVTPKAVTRRAVKKGGGC